VGLYAGYSADSVLAGFPSGLFVMLAGVTTLFALAEANGTIGILARRLLSLARGRYTLVPILILSDCLRHLTVGPGAIVSVALVAPVGMALTHAPAFHHS
jgi:hypothetical protein